MIVRAGVLYDGTLEPPKQRVDVVIDGGRVAEIRAATGECDLEAACVTPGLVNAHAHLEGSGEPDMMGMIPDDHAEPAAAPRRRERRQVGEGRGHDDPRRGQLEPNRRRRARRHRGRAAFRGPRMRASGAVLCMTGGHGWPIGRAVDSPWDARKAVREQMWGGADCIKIDRDRRRDDQGRRARQRAAHLRRAGRRDRRGAPARAARRGARDRHAGHQERAARRHRLDRARHHARRRGDRALQRAQASISCRR